MKRDMKKARAAVALSAAVLTTISAASAVAATPVRGATPGAANGIIYVGVHGRQLSVYAYPSNRAAPVLLGRYGLTLSAAPTLTADGTVHLDGRSVGEPGWDTPDRDVPDFWLLAHLSHGVPGVVPVPKGGYAVFGANKVTLTEDLSAAM